VVTFATYAPLREEPPIFIGPQNSKRRRNQIMKTTNVMMLVMTIAVALFTLIPNLSWAEDGAALYKAKMRHVPRRGCDGKTCCQDSEPGFGRSQEDVRR
jgi:hypothetical protein